jgi:hypothetical protein
MADWKINEEGIFISNNQNKISYPEEGNDDCFESEDVSPWFNQRNDLILALLKKHQFKGDFLDIGGGNGFQAKAIMESGLVGKVILCEPGLRGCINAKKRGVNFIYNGIYEDFPFNNYSIKGCGLFDVIEHISDDIGFLNSLYHKIQSGTKIFINVPAMHILWTDVDKHSGHFRRYSTSDINRIARNTQFKVIDSGYYFSFYFLPMFLLRVIPFKLGIKKSKEKLFDSEKNNHQSNNGILSSLINRMHHIYLKGVYKNKYAKFGTSIFIVLEK